MATSLRPLQSEMSSLDWPTTKTPVISNHILTICRRNSFICIYSNLVPKLVAMVTQLCPMCTGVSQMNSLVAEHLPHNQTLHEYVAYNWSYGHFCDISAYFGQNLVAMATFLIRFRPLQSEMPSLDCPTTNSPVISNRILTICRGIHLYVFIAILVQKLVAMVTPLCPLCTGVCKCHRWIPS